MRGSSGGLGRKAGADREEYGATTLKNGPTIEPWEWPKDCLKINLPGRTWCTTLEFEEMTFIELLRHREK